MKKLTLIFSVLFLSSLLNAQYWNDNGNTGTNAATDFIGTTDPEDMSFRTDDIIRMRLKETGELGIGVTSPSSWLHVKSTGTKETFRTDVPSTYDNYWRMYRNGTEYGRFINFDNATAFYIQAPRGHLRFASGTGGTATGAMEIREQGGADAGYVGIGNYSSFSPSCRLQVHEATASTPISFQLSNNTTGASSTDGLRISNDNSGRVTVYNWEDDDIAFGTGNAGGGGSLAERMIISSGLNFGRVGIGIGPGAQLDVFDATDLTIGGDDIGMKVTENLASTNSSNRAIAQELHAENGDQTLGINLSIDNIVNSSGRKMYGIWNAIRSTGATNVDDAEGMHVYMVYADNKAVRKTGIYCEIGNNSGSVTNTANTWGGIFIANSSAGNNFGVWASAPIQTCSNTSCAGAAGFFNGDVYASNNVYQSSDATIKTNITPLLNATAILNQLSPKEYEFNKQIHPNLNLSDGTHFGFIAQDVEPIVPHLVKEFRNPAVYDSSGVETYPAFDIKSLNYIELIPLIVAGFKEQQVTINGQKATIDSLILALQNATPLPKINTPNSQKISLSNVSSIILNQNDPNPFTESTRITFQIPDEVEKAKIIFTSSSGSIINTAIINERGAGELEVYSSELSKGLYTYTLVCDGKVIASKKMVKQ